MGEELKLKKDDGNDVKEENLDGETKKVVKAFREKLDKIKESLKNTQVKDKFLKSLNDQFKGKKWELTKGESGELILKIGDEQKSDLDDIMKKIENIGYSADNSKISVEGEIIDKPKEWGRTYVSGGTACRDLSKFSNIRYEGYSSSKDYTGSNLGINAKAVGKSVDSQHLFQKTEEIELKDGEKAYLVVGETTVKDKIFDFAKDDYKEKTFEEFKDDISKKTTGFEAWAAHQTVTEGTNDSKNTNKLTINEVGDPEVHRFVQVDLVNRGTMDSPIMMEKQKDDYNLNLNGDLKGLPINKEKIQSMYKFEGGKLQKQSGKIDLEKAPEGMQDNEEIYVMADGLKFGTDQNAKEYDVVFKVKKEGEKLVAEPTDKIDEPKEENLGFGKDAKFDVKKYMKGANGFKEIGNLSESNEQQIEMNSFYGWGDLRVNLKFGADKKTLEGVTIQTVGGSITIKNFGNSSIKSYDQKGFADFYDNVWNVVSSSLYNATLANNNAKGEKLFDGGVEKSNGKLTLDCNELQKAYDNAKGKEGFAENLREFLKNNKYDENNAKVLYNGYEGSRYLLDMGLVSQEQYRRTFRKDYWSAYGADMNNIKYEGLGDIVAKFEAGGDVGCVSLGNNDRGGVSYGMYQLASKMGSIESFLTYCQTKDNALYNELAPLKGDMFTSSGRFATKRKEIGAREKGQGKEGKFYKLQQDFFKIEYFAKPLESSSLKPEIKSAIKNSKKLQEAFFSTCIQHGQAGGPAIINDVVKAGKSENENIDAIYAKREDKMPNCATRYRAEREMIKVKIV